MIKKKTMVSGCFRLRFSQTNQSIEINPEPIGIICIQDMLNPGLSIETDDISSISNHI